MSFEEAISIASNINTQNNRIGNLYYHLLAEALLLAAVYLFNSLSTSSTFSKAKESVALADFQCVVQSYVLYAFYSLSFSTYH